MRHLIWLVLALGCTPFEDLEGIEFRAADESLAPDAARTDGEARDGRVDDAAPAEAGREDGAPADATHPDGAAHPDAGLDAEADGAPDAEADGALDAKTDAEADAEADAGCLPDGPEICDGRDNDCDGFIDNREDCCRPGDVRPCGFDRGVCRRAEQTCTADFIWAACPGLAAAGSEICNGLDDDCNGGVDEPYPSLGEPCAVGVGACRAAGVRICAADGQGTVCGAEAGVPRAERCTGADEDCDGATDEGFGLGEACAVGIGACAREGLRICAVDGGGAVCSAAPGLPADERCNRIDDDCDGNVDEDFRDLGLACTAGLGVCAAPGTWRCADDGTLACVGPVGAPGVEACNGLDDDCDGHTDEGFGLGGPCFTAEGDCRAEGITVCDEAGAPTCTARIGEGVEETCDGFDNDCDGAVDETFDRLTDDRHCGACGNSCLGIPDAVGACAGGGCYIARCADHTFDLDGFHGNGCEGRAPDAPPDPRVIVVDAALGRPGAPGTRAEPVPRIADGLALARPGDVVEVRAGRYEEHVAVNGRYVTLRGVRRDDVFVVGSVSLRGEHARVESLTVDADGGDVGIALDCARGCAVVDNVVTNVGDPAVPAPARRGIRLVTGVGHVVHGNTVEGVRGGVGAPPAQEGCIGGVGGTAAGIQLDSGATHSRVSANVVSDVRGGDGADPGVCPNPPNLCPPVAGGPGGPGYGINFADRPGNHLVVGNTVRNVSGGNGGAGVQRAGGGQGGRGAGIRLDGANNRLLGNRIVSVAGGLGGPSDLASQRGRDAPGFGVYFALDGYDREHLSLDEPALDNEVARSNTVNGEPVVYCYGQEGVEVSGLRLTARVNPTNLGKIALVACHGAVVRGNEIAGYTGDIGALPPTFDALTTAGVGAGITVLDARDVVIEDNVIRDLTGGPGAQGAIQGNLCGGFTTGSTGGFGAGIHLVGVSGGQVSRNQITGVTGGPGGRGGHIGGTGGRGGHGAAFLLVDSRRNTFAGNQVDQLAGGAAGLGGRGQSPPQADVPGANGRAGRGYGFYLDRGDALRLDSLGNTIAADNLVAGRPVLYVHAEDGRTLEGATLDGATEPTNVGRVVVLDARGVTVRGNQIGGVRGEPGHSGIFFRTGSAGGEAVAIYARNAPELVVEGNRVTGVTGGDGGPGGFAANGGDAGRGVAVQLVASPGARLRGNSVITVRGGARGLGGSGVAENPGGATGDWADAVGVEIEASDGAQSRNDLVADIVSDAAAHGIRFFGAGNMRQVEVRHATVYAATGAQQDSYGIVAEQSHVLRVTDSIVAISSHYGVGAIDGARGTVDYSNVWFALFDRLRDVTEPTGSNLDADPLFLDPIGFNFRLRADSPSVDAGDPNALCGEEPSSQNGACILDQGHLGGTDQARAR